MKKAIIGKKIGMTQIFTENGAVIPVTLIEAGPCAVVQKKTMDKDGYSALQLGFSDIAERKLTNPVKGHFKKSGVVYKKYLKEFRLENAEEKNVGDTITAEIFAEGDSVDVTGITKGHGYTGAI
ncbi:MAG: 50S ribosomal protein L3, partial [Clostridia bacterium]|nr:50S ribosomal protein L3 [Clostridia bacterium]